MSDWIDLKRRPDGWCLGTGYVALDIVRSFNGEEAERRFAGGSCGNVLTILSFLGLNSAPIARIGQDLPGTHLLDDLKKWSVDTQFLFPEIGRTTPVIFQEIKTDVTGSVYHRFSRVCPVCGERTKGYRAILKTKVPEVTAVLPAPLVFFFDRVAVSNLELAKNARARGALVVFEPSGIKDAGLFFECLKTCHILKYSHESNFDIKEIVEQAEVLIEIETRGEYGLILTLRHGHNAKYQKSIPAVPAPRLHDAAGSGDWCSAGLIYSLLQETVDMRNITSSRKRILQAVQFGQSLAALNCAYEGARGLMYAMPKTNVLSSVKRLIDGVSISIIEEYQTHYQDTNNQGYKICGMCDRKLD